MKSKQIQKYLEFGLDLIFPVYCLGCGQEGIYLCLHCQGKIESPLPACPLCHRPAILGQIHDKCRDKENPLRGIMVASSYHSDEIKRLIWYLKYLGVKKIASTLALLMADYLTQNDLLEYFEHATITAVPLHKRRLRMRGYNQAELIGRSLAGKIGADYRDLLIKPHPTKHQVGLPKDVRIENLQNAFTISNEKLTLEGRKIIIIDDVSSTGTTLVECAKTLQKQNPSEIWGLVVARN